MAAVDQTASLHPSSVVTSAGVLIRHITTDGGTSPPDEPDSADSMGKTMPAAEIPVPAPDLGLILGDLLHPCTLKTLMQS